MYDIEPGVEAWGVPLSFAEKQIHPLHERGFLPIRLGPHRTSRSTTGSAISSPLVESALGRTFRDSVSSPGGAVARRVSCPHPERVATWACIAYSRGPACAGRRLTKKRAAAWILSWPQSLGARTIRRSDMVFAAHFAHRDPAPTVGPFDHLQHRRTTSPENAVRFLEICRIVRPRDAEQVRARRLNLQLPHRDDTAGQPRSVRSVEEAWPPDSLFPAGRLSSTRTLLTAPRPSPPDRGTFRAEVDAFLAV